MAKTSAYNALIKAISLPLTVSMVKTLIAACVKQSKGEVIGPVDLGASFVKLVDRHYIDYVKVLHKGKVKSSWVVTNEGRNALKELNFDNLC